ncbi:MAG: PEP/pyruvate-binding domain-containing protein [Anaerolineales bacterium]
MSTGYIYSLNQKTLPTSSGSKALNLRKLVDNGFEVPETYVCTWQAYHHFLASEAAFQDNLRSELAKIIKPGKKYAVRSSANLEDHVDHSFAGQFTSVLNVQGLDNILGAIQVIWEAARSPQVQSYFEQSNISNPEILMGVLIQEMIDQKISGVSFSKNPITGLDEIIIEAVEGNGIAIVQQGVTPSRWIYKWGEWVSLPENADIEQALIQQVVDQTKSIAKFYGKPADLEWVFDGDKVYWLQLREISSIEGINFYSNKIAQDMLPGMIKPLIWSINIPLVNGAWVKIFSELIGSNDIDPLSLAKSFYYRAYFNMGVIGDIMEMLGLPRETLELMTGVEIAGPDKPKFRPSPKTYRLLPRMLKFALGMLRKPREIERFYLHMNETYARMQSAQIANMNEIELLNHIERLFELTQTTAYYNIITPLTMQFFNALLKKQLEKQGVDFSAFDLTRGLEELREVDPNYSLNKLAVQFNVLNAQQREIFSCANFEKFMEMPACESLQQGIVEFREKFGHLSDNGNDFSYTPWRETPDLILKMIKANAEAEHKEINKTHFEDLRLGLISGIFLKSIYNKARQYFLYREQIGSLYTYGYGMFREYFLALGEKFSQRGLFNAKEDIFYLNFDEIKAAVDEPHQTISYNEIVNVRIQEMEKYRDITPPTIIFGDQPLPIEEVSGTVLEGTPTSRGYYQGRARVVHGIEDIEKIENGDVLVVPYSDVGWTPIYVHAGAVVAESGGMLSHSSIVAREYGIPAVVSVPNACKLLAGKVVTVDGYRGQVKIHED